MNFTPEQERACRERGNTLVVAGAGAGKTKTLVERCLRTVLESDKPGAIGRVLVVTFTEAAAAEVRKRIRQELEHRIQRDPKQERLQEEMALLDYARISTLHSFCYSLVRENFFELAIDPAARVMDEVQTSLLFETTLDELLREHYELQHPDSGKVLELIRAHFGGQDQHLRELIREIHQFTQTRPQPTVWFQEQIAELEQEEPAQWEGWYSAATREWCEWWLPFLNSLPEENTNAHYCADLLRQGLAGELGAKLAAVVERSKPDCWPKRMKGKHEEPIKKLFEEAAFLASLQPQPGSSTSPLAEDWTWTRHTLLSILRLAHHFSNRFAEAKRERGALDFHDLEQFTLALLWDSTAQRASPLALEWQERLEAIFVDEYQDINAAQDMILTLLARPFPPGNRFLVGDMKQSIYGFRQADPFLFQGYFESGTEWAEKVHLQDNFRSHESILKCINPFFGWLMRKDYAELDYNEEAALKFGNPAERLQMTEAQDSSPRVELHLFLSGSHAEPSEDESASGDHGTPESNAVEKEKAEAEARRVGQRLKELREDASFTIWDTDQKIFRKPDWSDMVVLLRATKNKTEAYAKAFHALGIPFQGPRTEFYHSPEVLDLCNLLHILDNPLQDLPLVAVLRSPLGGMDSNDLARIRVGNRRTRYWYALSRYLETKAPGATREKAERFLEIYHRWRGQHSISLAERLETILADTGYLEWLAGEPRGKQRVENLLELVRIARQFDTTRGESLYLFLRQIEKILENVGDIEPPCVMEQNAVRLMTIHQSKGLEFPIVALPDLGKNINFGDLARPWLLHETYGLCTMVRPPGKAGRYPSLPLWLARREKRFSILAEEMRVLYVALTRAKNHLLLFGSTTEKTLDRWVARAREVPFAHEIARTRCVLEWIGTYLTVRRPDWHTPPSGEVAGLRYIIARNSDPTPEAMPPTVGLSSPLEENDAALVRSRFAFTYPFAASTKQPAKTSVSMLRKADLSEEDVPVFVVSGSGSGTDRGKAHHKFLQLLALEEPIDRFGIEAQAKAMLASRALKQSEFDLLNLDGIAAFWESELGRQLVTARDFVQRELPFTARMSREDLRRAGITAIEEIPPDEFIILQGVADLVMIGSDELWVLDFKTDRAGDLESLTSKYRVQIELYALGLNRIYKRPVTRKALYFLETKTVQLL